VQPFAQIAPLTLALGLTAGAAATLIWAILRKHPSSAELERRRRLAVNAEGRLVDATLLDLQDDELCYSYTVRGVEYTAAQNIAGVREFLPEDSASLVGPAMVKYTPRRPGNSIVICEEWSGLRDSPARSQQDCGERSPV
jgi:hypothetical protein